jgi:hypothetical protein
MANVERMWQFFDAIDYAIEHTAPGDANLRKSLRALVFRILTVCDGLEGPEGWKGIALVAREDLPPDVEEINDEFLHDAWVRNEAGRNGPDSERSG